MSVNSAASQFAVDTSKYDVDTSNAFDAGNANWFADLFTLGYTAQKRNERDREIEGLKASNANALEEARLNSARQFEEYMDSTKYQRAVKDAEAAGINPYLLFSNNINTSAGSSATAVKSHKAGDVSSKANGSSSLISSALKILAILALK